MDRDKLINASPAVVAQATYSLVDQLQHSPAHVQLAAAAVLFTSVAKRWGAQPQDIFTVTGNLMSDPIHGERPEFRALRLYVEHELK